MYTEQLQRPDTRPQLEQRQLLSQRQMQSLTILAMNMLELSQYIEEAMADNPVLELTGRFDSAAAAPVGSRSQADRSARETGDPEELFPDCAAEDPGELRDGILQQLP